MTDASLAPRLAADFWSVLGGNRDALAALTFVGTGDLPSVFAVSDLAAASIGIAGLALAEFRAAGSSAAPPSVTVDRRLASFWFGTSLRPTGWDLPAPWDPFAGDYPTADGWIRLHTNAPHHRAAALNVLGRAADRAGVAAAVTRWSADGLEAAIMASGGCAARMRSAEDWATHPQGRAVAIEPLLHRARLGDAPRPTWAGTAERPLAGIRVLDLTRVLAGPTATRFLAGFGAEVLRIDPPNWDEAALAPEMTLGKRCALLDFHKPSEFDRLKKLIAGADVLVHGYRPNALPAKGLDSAGRRGLNLSLVDVCLSAYGWTGPWKERRGFDSLVQMSSGIADAGMRRLGRAQPTPLPVQALDHATGYLMAAAVLRGLTERRLTGRGSAARASLARTAHLLLSHPADLEGDALAAEREADLAPEVETTVWGPARRLLPPLAIHGTAMRWDRPAGPLGAEGHHPSWT